MVTGKPSRAEASSTVASAAALCWPYGVRGTERVVFGHRQPIIRDPVGADGRALHDMRDVAIGA